MNEETPSATIFAFHELRDVATARRGERFREVRDSWPSAARAALDNTDLEALVSDDIFHEALITADDVLDNGSGELVRAVGVARANAIIAPIADSFDSDPFRFLKEGASLVYQGRANFGASSVEVAPRRAVLRLVAPEHAARKTGDAPPRGPLLVAAFLERAIELIAGEPQIARYTGHAPRVDARFDRPMVNLLYEFELDEP
jgi:hypothetical protein